MVWWKIWLTGPLQTTLARHRTQQSFTLFLHLLFYLARLFNFLSLQPCFLLQINSSFHSFCVLQRWFLPTILHNTGHEQQMSVRLPLRWSVSALRVAAILAETSLYTHFCITLVHFRDRQLKKSYNLPTDNSQQVPGAERNFWRLTQSHDSP